MKIKEAHHELYEYMRRKHEKGEQFSKADLIEIYSKFVIPNKMVYDYREFTEEQIYRNALSWLDRAIPVLIRRGYLGLTFRKNGIHNKEKKWQQLYCTE